MTAQGTSPAVSPWLLLGGWFLVAGGVALSGVFPMLPRPVIPLALFGGVAAGVASYRRSPGLRAWAAGVDLRVPVAYQLVRLGYGAYFLLLLGQGKLPAAFAETAGYGDIAAGLLAAAVLVALSAGGRRPTALLWVWSAVGMIDMALVVARAQWLLLVKQDEQMLAIFARPQFTILPLFVVPLVFLTHGLVLTRLTGDAAAGEGPREAGAV